MPTTNARKHVIPSGTDQSITRATIFETFGNSIRDVVGVATVTARTQLVTDLTAVGQGPTTARPLVVYRADAPGLHRVEASTDGTNWIPVSGALTFASKAAADSFGTSFGGLLVAGDECRVGSTVYRWSGTLWYLPTAGGVVSASTSAAGVVQVTHGMGKVPVAASVTISATSPIIGTRLKAQVGTMTATTFDVVVLRNDSGDTIFASNAVVFHWVAVA